MRIKNVEIYFNRDVNKKIVFYSKPFHFYLKGICGCHLFDFILFGVTFLRGDCINPGENNEE